LALAGLLVQAILMAYQMAMMMAVPKDTVSVY
jgi:hypothetical protein